MPIPRKMIRPFTLARELRDRYLQRYFNRMLAVDDVCRYYWQPPLLVIIKLIMFFLVVYKIFSYYTVLGDIIEDGFKFFKLSAIFNFKFPEKKFFYSLSKGVILLFLGYHGLIFIYYQITGLLSSIAVNRKKGMIYYLKNSIYKHELYSFRIDEIKSMKFKQIIFLGRIFNIGSVQFTTKSGEIIMISSIGNINSLASQISSG